MQCSAVDYSKVTYNDVKLSKVHSVTQVTWEECKETCTDECSEQHFKESVTYIVQE